MQKQNKSTGRKWSRRECGRGDHSDWHRSLERDPGDNNLRDSAMGRCLRVCRHFFRCVWCLLSESYGNIQMEQELPKKRDCCPLFGWRLYFRSSALDQAGTTCSEALLDSVQCVRSSEVGNYEQFERAVHSHFLKVCKARILTVVMT